MKKLLILMLVLGLASVSQAATVGLSVGGSSEYSGTAGETITIDLIADAPFNGYLMLAVEGDAATATTVLNMGGTAALPVGVGANVTTTGGYLNNYNGQLFDYASAICSPALAGGNVIVSFQYTISAAWDGTTGYWIAPLVAGTSYEYAPGSFDTAAASTASLLVSGTPTPVAITGVHIIPEPMTIALLGLGGLVLLRRRK